MVIRSNFRLGNKFLLHINLGINTGIFIYLENTKMYPLTKSITPATIVCNSLVYTGSNLTALIASVTLDGDTLIEGTDYIILNNGGTDVGTYNVTIQGIGDYVDTSTDTFNIIPATGSANISGVSLTYNGYSRNLVTVSGNTGTMHYRVGTDGAWSTSIPTATNTGSWTIYYYMDASLNYTARGSSSSPWGSVSSSIGKANLAAPTVSGSTTTYPTTATASASGGGGQGSIEWESAQSQTSVGSHNTRARWTGNGNYNASPWSSYVTVLMIKANLSAPSASGSTVTYGNTATATASGGGGLGSIEWSNGNTRTAAGSLNTQARWSGNGNYNASGWSNTVTLTVTNNHRGYDFVDLGLPSGTKWATMNVGASNITDYGNYYLWGYGSTVYSLGLAALDDPWGNRNLTDEEDTARKVWGGLWHMPTREQVRELTHIDNTSKSVITVNGVNMFKFTSKHNSNYVLFPFPGEYSYSDGTLWNDDYTGNYWTRTPDGTSNAYTLYLVRLSTSYSYWSEYKSQGCSVRPVIG